MHDQLPQSLSTRPIAELIANPLQSDHRWFLLELDRQVGLAGHIMVDLPAASEKGMLRILDHLKRLRGLVSSHIDTEEFVLFPLASSGRAPQAREAIRDLEIDHRDITAILTELRKDQDQFRCPTVSAGLWMELCESILEFERRKQTHVEIEGTILFPRVIYADGDKGRSPE